MHARAHVRCNPSHVSFPRRRDCCLEERVERRGGWARERECGNKRRLLTRIFLFSPRCSPWSSGPATMTQSASLDTLPPLALPTSLVPVFLRRRFPSDLLSRSPPHLPGPPSCALHGRRKSDALDRALCCSHQPPPLLTLLPPGHVCRPPPAPLPRSFPPPSPCVANCACALRQLSLAMHLFSRRKEGEAESSR